jgi:hypothetical protein
MIPQIKADFNAHRQAAKEGQQAECRPSMDDLLSHQLVQQFPHRGIQSPRTVTLLRGSAGIQREFGFQCVEGSLWLMQHMPNLDG